MEEIAVAKLLTRLGPEWTVLHAVPVGTGATDIDHVLIGPGGVFTLNTKNHTGQPVWASGRTLMVAGQRQPHIPKAAHEAARAQKLLTAAVGNQVPVTGLIVLAGARSVTVKNQRASPWSPIASCCPGSSDAHQCSPPWRSPRRSP